MANKKGAKENAVADTSKAIDSGGSKIAPVTGSAPDATPAPKKARKIKIGKLTKKKTSRLPRKQKKAVQKAAAARK
jgi:hypothetical protein